MLKPILIFCHGFGLSTSYWDKLLPYFQDFKLMNLNLGYFAQPFARLEFTKDESSPIFAIGHSLGWAKLEKLGFEFQASVGLQAFRHFLGFQPELKQKRLMELEQLQTMLARNPKSCLRYFYQRCGLSALWSNPISINSNLLSQDLNQLASEWQISRQHPKLILGSEQDPIVTAELIIDNFDKQDHVDYILLPQGQHDLGFNHPEIVAPIIRDFFNAHQQN